jgi:chromodomain-helicase-DNA-binding protein 1
MGNPGASDSGQDSKSEGRNAVGSDDNVSNGRDDRLDSEDEEGQKEAGKGGKGHSDVPADEMLSDEYYEQDGEDQSDSVHYRGFSQSVDLSSRLQKKPVPIKNNVSRRSRGLHNSEGYDDNNNDGDADYEEEEVGNFFVIVALSDLF